MTDGQVLEFSGVTKQYGNITAVSQFSARIEPGLVTGFLGPNGAGKTTSLRVLLGLVSATSGTATVGGVAYRDLKSPLQSVGAALEANSFHPGRTAANHLKVYATAGQIPLTRIDEVLEQVGLTDAATRKVGGFSLGMRQRLAIATALLGDPGVLVLDEPSNGLDPEGIKWMRTFLRKSAREGRTVFVSSHMLSEIQQIADKVIIIADGKKVFDGHFGDLIAMDATDTVTVDAPDRGALAAALREAGLSADVLRSGLSVRGATTAEIGAAAAGAGIALSSLGKRGPSVEDIFLDLVSGARVFTPEAEPLVTEVAEDTAIETVEAADDIEAIASESPAADAETAVADEAEAETVVEVDATPAAAWVAAADALDEGAIDLDADASDTPDEAVDADTEVTADAAVADSDETTVADTNHGEVADVEAVAEDVEAADTADEADDADESNESDADETANTGTDVDVAEIHEAGNEPASDDNETAADASASHVFSVASTGVINVIDSNADLEDGDDDTADDGSASKTFDDLLHGDESGDDTFAAPAHGLADETSVDDGDVELSDEDNDVDAVEDQDEKAEAAAELPRSAWAPILSPWAPRTEPISIADITELAAEAPVEDEPVAEAEPVTEVKPVTEVEPVAEHPSTNADELAINAEEPAHEPEAEPAQSSEHQLGDPDTWTSENPFAALLEHGHVTEIPTSRDPEIDPDAFVDEDFEDTFSTSVVTVESAEPDAMTAAIPTFAPADITIDDATNDDADAADATDSPDQPAEDHLDDEAWNRRSDRTPADDAADEFFRSVGLSAEGAAAPTESDSPEEGSGAQ